MAPELRPLTVPPPVMTATTPVRSNRLVAASSCRIALAMVGFEYGLNSDEDEEG